MKKTTVLFAMLSGLVLMGSQSTLAGNRPGAVTFTPGVTYNIFADKRNLTNTFILPTVALAYNFDEYWGLEGLYGRLNTSYDAANVSGSTNGNVYTVDALYHFAPRGRFEPYAIGGLGITYLNPNGNSANSQANLNAGLGAQLFFDDSIALRGEARDLYTMSGGKNDVMLSVGISFLFGGNKPEAVVAPVSYKGENIFK